MRDTILVVDDDDSVVETLSMILSVFGWRVVTGHNVESGRVAFEADADRLAAVFCDMLMEQGLRNQCAEDLFRVCRKALLEQGIPFTVMSGAFSENRFEGPGTEGMHQLGKPFKMAEVEAFLLHIVPIDQWPAGEEP